ncbi:hypothetical protein OKW41_006300 [Paraburkholderia sp. UCT70]|uniref:hypothetical protein n=1 Tax=Paraburkholderia sp. UCT70 TaxID=2991068 RepID=UPI003D2338BA
MNTRQLIIDQYELGAFSPAELREALELDIDFVYAFDPEKLREVGFEHYAKAETLAEPTSEPLFVDKAPDTPPAQPAAHFIAYRAIGLSADAPLIAVYSAEHFQSLLADSEAPAAAATSSYRGEQLFVASLLSAERVAAYRDLEVREGAAVMAQLLALSAPSSHGFLTPVHGFGSSVPAAIDHLKARAVYVVQATGVFVTCSQPTL